MVKKFIHSRILHPSLLGLCLLSGFFLDAKEVSKRVYFSPDTYLSQMITLIKATGLIQDVWIEYIIERAEFYQKIVIKLDRYPVLANLEYVGKAKEYAYDFLAMQAIRCERYRNLLLKQQQEAFEDPEQEFQNQAFKNCVSILYSKIHEALVDLKLKSHDKKE